MPGLVNASTLRSGNSPGSVPACFHDGIVVGFLALEVVFGFSELRVAVSVIGEVLGLGLAFQGVNLVAMDVEGVRVLVFIPWKISSWL